MAAVPEVNRRVVEALLHVELPNAQGRRLVLVHGSYDPHSPAEFSATIGGSPFRVHVTDQRSVLGIVEAWHRHNDATSADGDILVVTTDVEDAQLGWDLRAYAVRRSTRTVDRVEIVKQRFGAADVDPRIRQESWLVDALLDAEPADGWRRGGSVLTRDAAVRSLIGARLGVDEPGEGSLDMDRLLTWSRSSGGPERFAELPVPERTGLTGWFAEFIGGAATILLGLAAAGRAADAMPLGVVGTATTDPKASTDSGIAFGALLGGLRPSGVQRRAFIESVEGTLERWVAEAETTGPAAEQARQRLLDVVERADELAEGTELADALAGNRFVPSGLSARLRVLADALATKPGPRSVAAAEAALDSVRGHFLARLYPGRSLTAEMAVRVHRWLATPPPPIESVAAGIRAHLGEWGWVDRALSVLWHGDSSADPTVARAYRAVYEHAITLRDKLDEAFATRLTTWAAHASVQAPGGCLLVEDVMEKVVLPLVSGQAPLVVVLDGMSSAIAAELGEQLAGRAWTEVSPHADRRVAAIAPIPSVTEVSRVSLLTGGLTTGTPSDEKDGFTTFWRKHHHGATLFYQSDVAGQAGHRLSDSLVTALADDGVVGVVLSAVDHALEHGREGGKVTWRLPDITYLPELLDTARGYRRPVVLVTGHGHVLERSLAEEAPRTANGVESSRWRTGDAGPGEVELAGPRVVYGDGGIVTAWRSSTHYTARKPGYQGGASLSEMTAPVLVFLPSQELLPKGWAVLPPESTYPVWWAQRKTAAIIPPAPTRRIAGKTRPVRQNIDATPLFEVDTASAPKSVGARIVDTEIYAAQRAYVRKPPNKVDIASVIDAIVAADQTLSLAGAAAAAGRAKHSPEGFAITLQRLLNVEGYPVLSIVDGGRNLRLHVELLCVQFGIGQP